MFGVKHTLVYLENRMGNMKVVTMCKILEPLNTEPQDTMLSETLP